MGKDLCEFIFRVLFSLIFLALGAEHIVSDDLIQKLMPNWVPAPEIVSILVGIVLCVGGICIILGWQLQFAAALLGAFVVVVTLVVHLPALFHEPLFVNASNQWMWDILQRSNLAKNLCLIGVCFHLWHHQPGRWSLEKRLQPKS